MRRALLIAVVACGPSTKPPPASPPVAATKPAPPPAPVPPPAPPELRLPNVASPLHNTVELAIDPASEEFTGTITTDLEITKPLSLLWLNGKELTIEKATFAVVGATVTATPVDGGKEFVGLALEQPIQPGRATLAIRYRGKLHRNSGDGIYSAQEAGDWYAYTQFESTDARRAFPTFDEPSYKAPWKLAIHTKQNLAVFANTPIESETQEAGNMKLVRFVETTPLPSYLVAFAVGPFETVDAGTSKTGTPIRIVVPKGRAKDAAYAAEATRPLLELVEEYFGSHYPYPKLDLLACAVFNAGAMENPGLITYREERLLTKPEEQTLARQKKFATDTAHEIAHQWFGDYVTLAWWDDTWLNESFASWMESKIVEKWKPEWDLDVESVASKNAVMHSDSLDAARSIRQPIASANDIANAFDSITYKKGEAVLTMLEHWIGPDVFQKGVRAYLAKHAWGNATYDDFVAAMSAAAGVDEKPLFDAFVLQSGVPLVSFELQCPKGAAPKLALAQKRYAPTGSSIDPKRTWHLPICVRWSAGGQAGHDCTVLGEATGELALSAKSCPAWLLPNEGGIGYYRMQPHGDLLAHLLANTKALTLPERVSLIGDVNALVASGDVQKGQALELVETLAKDKSRFIVDASSGVVVSIDDMVPDKLRPNYERFIRKLYKARAHELGWQSKKGEDANTKELRSTLVALVADTGKDAELAKQATELAWKWLDDHKAVEPDLVDAVLAGAARNGDQKLFDRLHAEAKKATDRAERQRLLRAMGGFADPKIVTQALAIVLTNEFELREATALMNGAFREPRTRELAYEFVKTHFDEISNKLPEMYRPYMAFTFVGLCDDAKKPDIEAFFRPRIEKLDGGPRIMAQALESMSLCAAQRKAQAPGVEAFLKRQ